MVLPVIHCSVFRAKTSRIGCFLHLLAVVNASYLIISYIIRMPHSEITVQLSDIAVEEVWKEQLYNSLPALHAKIPQDISSFQWYIWSQNGPFSQLHWPSEFPWSGRCSDGVRTTPLQKGHVSVCDEFPPVLWSNSFAIHQFRWTFRMDFPWFSMDLVISWPWPWHHKTSCLLLLGCRLLMRLSELCQILEAQLQQGALEVLRDCSFRSAATLELPCFSRKWVNRATHKHRFWTSGKIFGEQQSFRKPGHRAI